MHLFSKMKKKEPVLLKAMVDGKFLPMEKIPDRIYKIGAVGPACALIPEGNTIYAPCGGEIMEVSENGHALWMTTTEGLDLIIQAGIGTECMKKEDFIVTATKGLMVQTGNQMLVMDCEKIENSGCLPYVILAVINAPEFGEVKFEQKDYFVQGEILARVGEGTVK